MKEAYENQQYSLVSLALQCRLLHAQTGRLSLLVALAEEGKEDFSRFRDELEKVRTGIAELEALLALQEKQSASLIQPSLLP